MSIYKYSWLVYPSVVAMVILFSSMVLLSPAFWQDLFNTASKVEAANTQANNLKTKLKLLEKTDINAETENLGYLLSILPSSKQIPVLTSQLQSAAIVSQTFLETYRFDAGDISTTLSGNLANDNLSLSVTYSVLDVASLRNLLDKLQISVPLLAIREVNFSNGKADLKIDALWSPLVKLSTTAIDQPLPNPSSDVLRIRQSFANSLPIFTDASASAVNTSISTNPF